MKDLREYSDEQVTAAEAGPHRGWETFDMKNEGVRVQHLHDLVSAPVFNEEEAESVLSELKSLAQSYGYGSADSFLFSAAGETLDEMHEKTQCMKRSMKIQEMILISSNCIAPNLNCSAPPQPRKQRTF